MKLVGVWLCVNLLCVYFQTCGYTSVFSYPNLYRQHSAATLTPASLFVLQFSLIFYLCGGHAVFIVVTHMCTFAIMLRLKVISTHFRIHTVAGHHVVNVICARIVILPLSSSSYFCMGMHVCLNLHTLRYVYCQRL